MEYEDRLTQEQLRVMDPAIESFLIRFAAHQHDAQQRTVIFLPGGLGSELVRANRSFTGLPGGVFQYETIWVDIKKVILEDGALLLQMNGNRDSIDRFVVADGALTNCAFHPYEAITKWFDANKLDLLMVGWDFRRNADWNVGFIRKVLIPEVQRRAANAGLPDPFKGATIIGHSFGGMVAKWLLNDANDPFCQGLRSVITVGTPFYGSTGQTERLFKSEKALGPFYNLDEVTTAIATMPGGFSLFFLDGATYDTFQPKLAADPDYPLDRYPSFDRTNRQIRVDPYVFQERNPANPNQCRYPIKGLHNDWRGWFQNYLAGGKADYERVARPLDPAMVPKLHNIRGVQTDGEGQDVAETKIMQQWDWYDMTRPRMPQAETVVQGFGGPGDGVIPAWSARLVTQPAGNIHTIKGDKNGANPMEHMAMLDHPSVRRMLLSLIRPGADQVIAVAAPRPATWDDYMRVRRDIERIALDQPTAAPAKEAVNRYLDSLPPEQQRPMAMRWLIELPKGEPPTLRLP